MQLLKGYLRTPSVTVYALMMMEVSGVQGLAKRRPSPSKKKIDLRRL